MKWNQFAFIFLFSLVIFQSVSKSETQPQTTSNSDVKSSENNSDQDASYYNRTPVPTGKYITGGVLGSAIGFGIGHGVQGRYSEGGLMFTLTEAAGGLVYFNIVAKCLNESDDSSTNKSNAYRDCLDKNSSSLLLGLGVMTGFRIWEIVDVWRGARPVDDEPKSSLMILPNGKDGAQLNFTYLF